MTQGLELQDFRASVLDINGLGFRLLGVRAQDLRVAGSNLLWNEVRTLALGFQVLSIRHVLMPSSAGLQFWQDFSVGIFVEAFLTLNGPIPTVASVIAKYYSH